MPTSPTFDPTVLDALSPADLLQRRAVLIEKGNGKPSDLDDNDLTELVAILALLRRRSSGPPGGAKKVAAKVSAPLSSLL